MGITQVQVRFPRDTGIPADDVINTWHFGHAAAQIAPGSADDVVLALANFYALEVPSVTGAVASFFANYLALENAEYKFYNVADPKPRVPYYTQSLSTNVARQGANDLPGEVAVCFSHQALPLSGQRQERRRSRIYLGPFNTDVLGPPVASIVPVHVDFRTSVKEAAQRMIVALDAIPVELGTYSRGKGTISQGSETETATADWVPFFTKSEQGWIDSAFDTVRSRGAAAQARLTFDL